MLLSWAGWVVVVASTVLPAPGQAAIMVDGEWSPWSTIKSYCVDPFARQNLVECGGGVLRNVVQHAVRTADR